MIVVKVVVASLANSQTIPIKESSTPSEATAVRSEPNLHNVPTGRTALAEIEYLANRDGVSIHTASLAM